MKRPVALLAAGASVIVLTTTLAQPATADADCRVEDTVASRWNGGSHHDVECVGTPSPEPTDDATAAPTDPAADPTDEPTAEPSEDPGDGVAILDRVHTAGRVAPGQDGEVLRFSWPGVYFEGRFTGTGVGVVLEDDAADHEIQIDGETVTTLVAPAAGTHRIDGLDPGEHTVRLVKRSESPGATSVLGGLVAVDGGEILDAPAPRDRQIEFIGDSYTAGYGLESDGRECTDDEVNRTTNADRSFGALTARALDADYQINAFSGRGMVRNYDGGEAGTSYRTYYERALLADPADVWDRPDSWQPQVVVIGLGINDFSTALHDGEPWDDRRQLVADYTAAYHGFLDTLRERYGDETTIVVSATDVSGTTVMVDATRQIVADRQAAGDSRTVHWYYPTTDLDSLGCHWHPSATDHEHIAGLLGDYLSTRSIAW